MSEKITITRTFDAPIEKIWEAWTNPEVYKQWMGPEGIHVSHCEIDLKVGGVMRYCMVMPDGKEMWMKSTYQKIEEPTFLSYKETMTDADGNPVPMPGFDAEGSLIEISLKQVADKTEVTLTQEFPTAEMGAPAKMGWSGAMDKLESVIADSR